MTLTILPMKKLNQAISVTFSIDDYFSTHREEYKGNFKIIIFRDDMPVLIRQFGFLLGVGALLIFVQIYIYWKCLHVLSYFWSEFA